MWIAALGIRIWQELPVDFSQGLPAPYLIGRHVVVCDFQQHVSPFRCVFPLDLAYFAAA